MAPKLTPKRGFKRARNEEDRNYNSFCNKESLNVYMN